MGVEFIETRTANKRQVIFQPITYATTGDDTSISNDDANDASKSRGVIAETQTSTVITPFNDTCDASRNEIYQDAYPATYSEARF